MIKAKPETQTTIDRNVAPEKCLADNVKRSIQVYFDDLDGHETSNLYALFMEEVEKPFFEVVMQYTQGNITHATKLLGLNRVTLRNRLKKYDLG